MTLEDLLARYNDLRGRLGRGEITQAEFEKQIGELTVQDDAGRWWTIGARTGKWYVSEGGSWVETQSPIGAEPVASGAQAGGIPKCPQCAEPIEEGDVFCGNCGAKLDPAGGGVAAGAPSSAPPAAPPTSPGREAQRPAATVDRSAATRSPKTATASRQQGGNTLLLVGAVALIAIAAIAIGGWWFVLRDDGGAGPAGGAGGYSTPPSGVMPPTAVPPPAGAAPATVPSGPPPSPEFTVKDLWVYAGECTELEWTVTNAQTVYLDGVQVLDSGRKEVCPQQRTRYTLTAIAADGTRTEQQIEVDVTEESPATEAAAPTETQAPPTDTPAPTLARPTAAPTLVPPTPTASAEPTPTTQVEFYPDNGKYEIPDTQLCTAVIWNTQGVTNLELERVGHGRKGVGERGREEVCFREKSVTMILYFTLPDGRQDTRTITITKK